MNADRRRHEGVIYFPYINVPDDDWFARTLLYWDEVACIIPVGYRPDHRGRQWLEEPQRRYRPDGRPPDERFAHTQELIAAGLVEALHPELPPNRAWPFLKDFVAYVAPDGERSDWAGSGALGVKVHRGKLGGLLLMQLSELGLARETPGQWIDVEPKTAAVFMVSLTAFLADTSARPLLPVTDHVPSYRVMCELATSLAGNDHAELRDSLLRSVLPAPPAGTVDWRDLAEFKQRHHSELRSFRRHIQAELRRLALIKDGSERHAHATDVELDLRERMSELEARMKEHGWQRLTGTALETLAVVAPGVVAATSSPSTAAIAAGPGLAAIAYRLLRPSHSPLEGEPLAYAVSARREFA